MVVVPPTIGQVREPGAKVPVVETPDVPTGSRLVEATATGIGNDVTFVVECPECGRENVVDGL